MRYKNLIKRICAAAAGAALVLPCLCGAAAQNGTAYYTADGTRLAPDGSAYRLADGRELRFDAEWPALRIGEGIDEKLMVPLRKASEAFDATVYWFNDTQVIQIVGNDRRLNLKIDSNTIDIYRIENNTTSFVKFLTMPEAARLINDTTTYVPLRAAADPLFADWATITAEDVVSIEDLKNKNPERAIQYADGTPATVTMPRVDIPPAAGLLQVTGTLRADGGGWKLVEDSGTEWTITNIPNDPSVPIDPAIFWSQQLDGIANPDGIRITMTASNEGVAASELPVRRTLTGIRLERAAVTVSEAQTEDPAVMSLTYNGEEVQSGQRLPVGAALSAAVTPQNESGLIVPSDYVLVCNGKTLQQADWTSISVPKEGIVLELRQVNFAYDVAEAEWFMPVGKVKQGEPVTLTVRDGYQLAFGDIIEINGSQAVANSEDRRVTEDKNEYTFIMPTEAVTVSVNWVKLTFTPEDLEEAKKPQVYYDGTHLTLTDLHSDLEYTINGEAVQPERNSVGVEAIDLEVTSGSELTIGVAPKAAEPEPEPEPVQTEGAPTDTAAETPA